MPDAIITSTASTFGTITGTFAADQSTITGTVTGIITGTLDGSVGVPGVGVPDGGTTGQVLQKATNTSYDTVWATPSGGAWGTITGTLSNQTDLQTALNLKAPLASPGLTGVPTAPTAATLTSTTQLATTAFVQQELLSGTANARNLEVYVRNQTGSTIPAGAIVYINGATGNRPTITLAQANNDANSAQTFGFVKTSIANNGFGFVIVRGELENIDTSALTEGVQLYLSPTTAGTWTTTKPSAPQHLVYVGICVRAHPTQGVILVAVQNGYELNELHDVQITSPTNGQVLKYNSSTGLWVNGLDVGIPVGGTAGQFLTKIDGTDYNTDWTTVNLSVYAVKSNNLSDLTSASTARTNLGLGTMATATASDYSTTTVANGLYYPLSTNPAGYLTSSSLTPYLTKADNLGSLTNFATARDNLGLGTLNTPVFAGVTVQGSGANVANLGATFLTLTHATSGSFTIQPSVGITFPDASVQTTAFTGIPAGYITSVSSPLSVTSGNLTIDLSAYLTSATAASTYQTLSGMSSYLTTSAAASTYYPLTGNPSGFITSSALTPYAPLAGADFTGRVTIASVAGGQPGLNIGINTGATGMTSGDLWIEGGDLNYYFGSSTEIVANQDWVNGSFYPLTGNPSGFITSSALTPYLTTATAASTYQTISGMSSYLTTASAASTYFTIASAANKADLASPALTGTPTAPTAAAATNTTQIATTAFVQQEVPAASTTAAGKVELATVDEALRPSSSTLGMTPETTREMLMYPGYINLFGGGNVATSGTGAASTFTFATQRWHAIRSPNATVAGYGMYIFDYSFSGIGMAAMTRGSSSLARKWNNKIWLSGRTVLGQFAETTSGLNGDANCTARVMLGGRSSAGTGGMQAADSGIGWRVAGGGSAAIVMTVSTGTTLTETTSSFTPVLGQVFDWKMYSDGTGNVTLWVNDSQVATSTGGPSTSTAETTNFYCEVVEQTASAATPLGMGNFGSKVFWSQA